MDQKSRDFGHVMRRSVRQGQGLRLIAFLLCAFSGFPLAVGYPQAGGLVLACRQARLQQDLQGGYYFGYAMAMDGTTLVIGSFHASGNTADTGAAYVYVRSSSGWTLQQKLIASDGENSDWFGISVAIKGDTILVGAYGDDDAAPEAGAAYVFVRSASVWTEQAKLLASDGQASDLFGLDVCLSPDMAVISAAWDDDLGLDSGSAYVFRRNGTTWTQQAKLLPSDGVAGDLFAYVVCDSQTIVVGAPKHDHPLQDQGAVYVFDWNGTSWTETQELLASDAMFMDSFGVAVSMDAGRIAVGAYRSDTSIGDGGAVYMFEWVAPNWVEQAKVFQNNATWDAHFGYAVALRGNRLLVGAPESHTWGPYHGSAFLFERTGTQWVQQLEFTDPSPTVVGGVGTSVALVAGTMAIGAPYDGMGSASVFQITPAPSLYCTAKVNSLGCIPVLQTSGSASATASSGYEIRCQQVLNNKPGLLSYGVNGAASMPFQGGTLCVAPPLRRTPVVLSGGNPAPANDCSGVLKIDMNAFASGALGGNPHSALSDPGSVVNCQWWGRDPGFTPPFDTMLSDALEYTVCL